MTEEFDRAEKFCNHPTASRVAKAIVLALLAQYRQQAATLRMKIEEHDCCAEDLIHWRNRVEAAEVIQKRPVAVGNIVIGTMGHSFLSGPGWDKLPAGRYQLFAVPLPSPTDRDNEDD